VDDVYKWTKAIIDHKDEIQKVHPQGREMRLVTKKELEISPVPIHPGVIKYAKEKRGQLLNFLNGLYPIVFLIGFSCCFDDAESGKL
jgi:hypothetical protein